MDSRVRIGGMALIVGLGLLTSAGGWSRPQPEEPGAPASGEPAEVEDAPGEAHAGLAALAGEWTSLSTFRMPDGSGDAEGADAEQGQPGAVRVESIMDGRFIAIHESGQMMGEPFESMKLFGFNNAAGLYESTWIYTGSTAMMRMRGTTEDGGRIITFQAQYATGPDAGERFLVTMSVRGSDEFVVTLVALLPDGSAGPALETVYTRHG